MAKRSKYSRLKEFKDAEFRRLTGVKRKTFEAMVIILSESRAQKEARGGHRSEICVQDQLLMALEYWREYRTYFHVGASYGLSESGCQRVCRWVEDTLIASGKFNLPGKKALLDESMKEELVLVDVSESPICRPKKRLEMVGA